MGSEYAHEAPAYRQSYIEPLGHGWKYLPGLIVVLLLLTWSILLPLFRLQRIPGPFLARWSNIPRLYWVWTTRPHEYHISLHKKYGRLVRFGPNMVSVTDPKEIQHIYDFAGTFPKSDFYRVLAFYVRGEPVQTIFATQDTGIHRMLRRPISNLYSMSNLVSFEPYVDVTIKYFFERLDDVFVKPDQVCEFDKWLRYFAFDVIGEITFSSRLGFLERGSDVDNIIHNINQYFNKAAVVTQMPWLDFLFEKNPVLQYLKTYKVNPMVAFANARASERKSMKEENNQDTKLNKRDFLSRFVEAIEKDPTIPPWALTAWTVSNITAGSDTTAILLRSIFYNLLKHPESLQRLLTELKEAQKAGRLSEIVTWKETRDLPFLDAVIKEAGRLHPPFGLPFERVVPPKGAVISGQHLPGGTYVGISAWAIHRDSETFGEDSDEWRPERWLCDGGTRKKMESALMTFGAGNRVCLGKHISYLEIYKLVPTVLKRYDISLVDPNKQWTVKNRWFVHQSGLNVRLRLKSHESA